MTVAAMQGIPVCITGVTPLLCGKPAEPRPELPPREQALARLYQDADGRPVIPSINLFRCLTGAARFLQLRKADVIQGVAVTQGEIPIVSERPWQVDSRTVRKPGGRERIACHRPRFDEWSLRFELHVDAELIAPLRVGALIEAAGQRLGLGDFRAERGGPFGRFRLAHWGWP